MLAFMPKCPLSSSDRKGARVSSPLQIFDKVTPNSALLINHNFANFAEKLLIPLISK